MKKGATKRRKLTLRIVVCEKNSNERPNQLSLKLNFYERESFGYFDLKLLHLFTCIVIHVNVFRDTHYLVRNA